MKTLINPETISNNTIDSVYNEVSEMLTNRGYNVVSNEEEAREMFAALYSEPSAEMYTREAQTFAVPGRVAGSFVTEDGDLITYQLTLTVVIFENYIDSASDDYIYTINITEE